jgi:outer membrane receptor protein involved in Fe transport
MGKWGEVVVKIHAARFLNRSSVAALALAAFLPASPVWAQDTDAETVEPQEQEPSAEETIVVTGSRLGRTSFNSPTPVNVIGEERMKNLAISDVGDALIQLPAFRPITGPSTNSFRVSNNISARTLDLRGLGPTRTLTLIDGRRTVPSGEDGRFDLNSLPSIMIQRSEVVTGGASAAYGADAVAGVVNLILNTQLEGFKGEASYGISDYGDGQQVRVGMAAGTSFAGGRGHIVIGGEYVDEEEVGDFNARPWAARWRNFPGNPFWSVNGGNTLPQTVSIDNVLFLGTKGGVVVLPGPLQGLQFDPNGQLIPFDFGDSRFFNPNNPGLFVVNPDPAVDDLYGFNRSALITPTTHKAVLGNVEYEISDSVKLSAGVSYAYVDGTARGAYAYNFGGDGLVINRDNAYLQPEVAALMDANGVTSFKISRANSEGSGTDYTSKNNTWRANVGLEGDFGSGWHWDAYYQWGQTKGRMDGNHIQLTPRWKAAADAVFAPAGVPGIVEGTIICRTTITNPTDGCIPTNVMGAGVANPATLEWAYSQPGDVWQTREFEQHVMAANVRGAPMQNWAGDVSVAAGVEYRIDKSEGDVDSFSKPGFTRFIAVSPLPRMTQKVAEIYLEAGMPLVKDSSVGSINVDGAVRFSDYNLAGSAWTWKGGLVWDVSDALMLRVTRSRDVRQPTAAELNPNRTVGALPLPDPKLNITYNIDSYAGGNPDLNLEKADTWTVGGVFQPGFIPGLRLSLDYYDITVNSAIDVLTAQLAVQLCREGNTAVCTVGTDVNGNADRILEVYSTYQNVNTLKARGLEMVMDYRLELDALNTLNFTVNGSYVAELQTALPDGKVINWKGVTGNSGSVTNTIGVPDWRADAILTWEQPTFSVTAHGRYVPPGLLNDAWIGPHQDGYSPDAVGSVSDNRIDSRIYLDLSASVKIFGEDDDRFELFGSVANVFNTDPPENLRLFGNGLYFDSFGRYYRVGVRVAM